VKINPSPSFEKTKICIYFEKQSAFKNDLMNYMIFAWRLICWLFALAVFAIGALHIVLGEIAAGSVYFLFSVIYLPPVSEGIRKEVGFFIPVLLKIIIAIGLTWFILHTSGIGRLFH
jgi:uncharacterized membrane protein